VARVIAIYSLQATVVAGLLSVPNCQTAFGVYDNNLISIFVNSIIYIGILEEFRSNYQKDSNTLDVCNHQLQMTILSVDLPQVAAKNNISTRLEKVGH